MTLRPVSVVCACGCKRRVAKTDAVGINGKWALRDHFDRVLNQLPSPRQLALLLRGVR